MQFNVLGPLELNLRGANCHWERRNNVPCSPCIAIPEPESPATDALVRRLGEVATCASPACTVHAYIAAFADLSDAGVDSRNILVSEPRAILLIRRSNSDLDRSWHIGTALLPKDI